MMWKVRTVVACAVVALTLVPSVVLAQTLEGARTAAGRVSFDRRGAELRDVLGFLHVEFGAAFLVDRSLPRSIPVTARVENATWEEALEAILAPAGLEARRAGMYVMIVPRVRTVAEAVASLPAAAIARGEVTRSEDTSEPVTIDVRDVELRELLRFFQQKFAINFVVDSSVPAKVPITVSFTRVPWRSALDAILASQRLVAVPEGPILRIATLRSLAEK